MMNRVTGSRVVTVFGSSKPREGEIEYETAREVGGLLAEAGFTVCNGGYGGIMEASARGAREAGGATIGVVARVFSRAPNSFIQRKILKTSLVDRLMKLIDLGDAYVVLPGGTGTLVELAMVWELMNKHLAAEKPIVVVGSFWTPVIKTLNEELAYEGRGFATKHVKVVSTPKKCVEVLKKRLRK